MFYRLGIFSAKYRWPIIIAWALVFLLSLSVLPRVASQLKGGFGDIDTESRRALDLLEDRFGTSESTLIVVFSSPLITTEDPAYRAEMEKVLTPLRGRPDVGEITTFYDGGTPSQVSPDGKTTFALVPLRLSIDEAIESFPQLEDSLGEGDLEVWTTGGVAIFSDINKASERDLRRGEIIAIPLVLVALVFVFRGLVAASIPVAVGAISVSAALALLFFVAQVTDVSIFALNIVSFLGLGVAVDYSLLVVSRFREEINRHPKKEAVAHTLATSGKTILFSGLTSMLGLSSLLLFDFMMLRSLGLGGVMVIMISLLVALTLLPAILAVVGDRVNAQPVLPNRGVGRGLWRRLALGVMRRPLVVAIPLLVFLVALGIPFLGVNLGSVWATVLPEDVPSRRGWDVVSERMGPGAIAPIVIAAQFSGDTLTEENTTRLRSLVDTLQNDPSVDRVESLISPNLSDGGTRPSGFPSDEAVEKYLSGDTTVIRVFSRFTPVADESRDLVRQIRSFDPGQDFSLMVTGATADLMDSIDVMYSAFPIAIIFVVVTVYIALFVLFRSVLLPLKATIMNLMSIFASYGALVFIFQQGHFQGLLGFTTEGVTEATIPILLFAIIFGLSMDYEIFLLSRIKEVYDSTGDNEQSVAQGMEITGPIITSGALILVLVAAAFATADIVIVKALGVGTAIAILLDATVVRAFLVPALMRIMDRWNWWSPQFLKRVIPGW
ncbi:MAG: MMPL family transporter [Chloroflexi bacterium]|nr:MMPL family transporter [Chloroflexota bacterium]